MAAEQQSRDLHRSLEETFSAFGRTLEGRKPALESREVGEIFFVGEGYVRARGLPGAQADELLRLPEGKLGLAFNLDEEEIAIILLDRAEGLRAGQKIARTGRIMDVAVGEELLGRVVDPSGRPLDGAGPIRTSKRLPIHREAAGIMDRDPVTVPLQTGIQAIDALIPIGRGQRELILGDRQTGKTAVAVDTIINQRDKDVVCVYCAIAQRASSVAGIIEDLRRHGAMSYCTVVVAAGEDPPGVSYVAPYAATSMAEYFMEQGRDALVVYDDLTRHARAYRELSLLLRRPPAREAYPGDIFYIHSRLLERSTHLKRDLGGGSLTALPIIETQQQNISAYIPTNLVSITDGQIFLSPKLLQEGILPPVDIGRSVSRVGGKTQFPAYRDVAGDLRLSYSQFEELESFSRFGVQLDEETRRALERGRRVREVLKQPQYQPIPAAEQIAVLLCVSSGLFDDIPLSKIAEAQRTVREIMRDQMQELSRRIVQGENLGDEERQAFLEKGRAALREMEQ